MIVVCVYVCCWYGWLADLPIVIDVTPYGPAMCRMGWTAVEGRMAREREGWDGEMEAGMDRESGGGDLTPLPCVPLTPPHPPSPTLTSVPVPPCLSTTLAPPHYTTQLSIEHSVNKPCVNV